MLESSQDLKKKILSVPWKISSFLTVFNQTVESITDSIAPLKKRSELIRKCDFFDTELM